MRFDAIRCSALLVLVEPEYSATSGKVQSVSDRYRWADILILWSPAAMLPDSKARRSTSLLTPITLSGPASRGTITWVKDTQHGQTNTNQRSTLGRDRGPAPACGRAGGAGGRAPALRARAIGALSYRRRRQRRRGY